MKAIKLREELETIERCYILRALEQTAGNKKKAAALLGMARRRFYRRLELLDLGERAIARRPKRGAS